VTCLSNLLALAAQAPPGAALVICHTPVLHQVTLGQTEQFARPVRGLGAA